MTITAEELRVLNVLVVEDDQVNQLVIKMILQNSGHNVQCCDNGREALDLWRNGSFEMILMDVLMPVMNGLDAMQLIRAEEAVTGRHTPVLALTAVATDGFEEKMLEAGFDGYLAKPFLKEELMEMMHKHL